MRFTPKIKEKVWEIKLEKKIFDKWTSEKIHVFNVKSKKKIFAIDTPPPYPSGRPWHIGAAAHYSQIDMIARTARMMGKEVYFPIGIDRNGVPVENYTEKKFNIRMQDTPREKFLELAKTALDDLEAEMIGIMKSMGLSGNFENYYRTDSTEYRKLTQTTFIMMWKKGLIYEDMRPNNFCIDCGTTIADADITYEDLPAQLVYMNWKVKDSDENIIIASTRPELICACQTLIVNPDDERFKHLHGKFATIPIYNREVKIIPHPAADTEFGSGALMICSYGDYEDVRLFRELGLKEVVAIDSKGRMTDKAGKYAGLKIKEARMKIIQDFENTGIIIKKENITHRTPICDRSNTPIEIISMKEFYLKQLDFKGKIKKASEKLKFHPEEHRQILNNWIDAISIDWPISRRRFYGTEIPVWFCKSCKKAVVPEPGKYYQPWKERSPVRKCPSCGGRSFTGDGRTFDTWFDSSISPLFITKFMKDKTFFAKTYPCSIRPQAKDIIRTWLYYTLLRCYQITGNLPFEHAWIQGYGVDEKGEKMSKSKGNVIDPIPILEKYGGDNFRFWDAAEASLGSDFRSSEQRVIGSSKFLTKLWNVAKYISMFPQSPEVKLTPTDRWILAELNKVIEDCMKGYEDFNFFIPANRIREFVWNVFAPHYLEMSKARAYGTNFSKEDQKAAWFTLNECLKSILLLLAPITPFLSDFVWRTLYGKKSIHIEQFPKTRWKSDLGKLTQDIIDFNSVVWNKKKEKNISLKDPIKIEIPKDLKEFEKDLIVMHNAKS
ncbi:MAG: valine--tRNA ligase [Candidatus Aenigmarchaeota archaeon]|nr:valine--tRNA ligase [Candidatus Aenigmarchaeota archaeon]